MGGNARSAEGKPSDGQSDELTDWPSMISAAIASGIGEDQFWRMTPAQLGRHYDGVKQARRAAFIHDMAIAWHSAVFRRAKTMPSLSDIVARIERGGAKPSAMDWQEMRANLRASIAEAQR